MSPSDSPSSTPDTDSEAPEVRAPSDEKPEPTPSEDTDAAKEAKAAKEAAEHAENEAAAQKVVDALADGEEDPPPESEEKDLWETLMKTYEEEGLWAAVLIAIQHWMGWGEDAEEDDGSESNEDAEVDAEEERLPYRVEAFEGDDPQAEQLLQIAKAQLEGLQEENPTWMDLAEQASQAYGLGAKGAAHILAMARFESGFDPNAVPKDPNTGELLSSAKGLGQFIDGTWEAFQNSLPADSPYKNKPATDPEASIMAIAWYSAENMKTCGIELNDPHFTVKLYEAHHEGPEGAKTLWTYRETGSPEGKIPSWAKEKSYADYAQFVGGISSKVQSVADFYKTELDSRESTP
jgi:hypothetical protein